MSTVPFWEVKSLEQMSDAEWESLCDGCGKCCLQKLQDEDTEEVVFTRIACKLLDADSCRCSDYKNRFEQVTDCLAVRPLTDEKLSWLPSTCAYKLLSEGQTLKNWHPLISGDPNSVIAAGMSMANRCLSELSVPLAEYSLYVIDVDDESGEKTTR